MKACRYGHHSCVKALLAFGATTDIENSEQMTALMIAKQYGNQQCMQLLLPSPHDVASRQLTGRFSYLKY
jgi:ankyrin repeat protein